MTVCNMSIEAGARAGLIAPDDTTFAYLEGRPPRRHRRRRGSRRSTTGGRSAPTTAPPSTRRSRSTPSTLEPHVTWGTNPSQVVTIDGARPRPRGARRRRSGESADAGARVHGPDRGHAGARHRRRHRVHRVVHQQPHRGPAGGRRGRRRPAGAVTVMRALVVPGSHAVKAQAEAEGLDRVFRAAGFDWREPGCSMCLAMNPDKLAPGERCASDVEPQLRGSPGPGRAHPPRVARRRRRHRRRRPLRHAGGPGMRGRAHRSAGTAVPLDRTDVDTDQIIPSRLAQAGRAHRLRQGPVRRVARRPRLRAQRRALRGRHDPGGRAQLRHRLVAASTPSGRSRTTASTP